MKGGGPWGRPARLAMNGGDMLCWKSLVIAFECSKVDDAAEVD